MSTLSHLWREWREHRLALSVFAGLVVAGALLLAVADPGGSMVAGGRMVHILTFGALLFGLAVVVPEIGSGETSRGTMGFLARLPTGLGPAFAAKVVFLGISVGGCTAFAFGVATLVRVVAAPETRHALLLFPAFPGFLVLGALVLAAAAWILAISFWVPRGILAVPALAFVAAPYALLVMEEGSLAERLDWRLHLLVQPLVGLFTAGVSFVAGRRHGGGCGSSAAVGSLVALAGSLPLWCGLWAQHREFNDPEPRADTAFERAFLSTDGATVFVTTARGREWPTHVLRVEVATGRFDAVGDPGDTLVPPGDFLPAGIHDGRCSLLFRCGRDRTLTAFDAETGRDLGSTPARSAFAGLPGRTRRAAREISGLRLPDGRRAWFLDGKLEADGADGDVETVAELKGWFAWESRGAGLRLRSTVGSGVFDFHRRKLYSGDRTLVPWIYVFERGWIVGPTVAGRGDSWKWRDPETGADAAVDWLGPGESPAGALLSDGRMLLRSADDVAVEPATGSRRRLRFPDDTILPPASRREELSVSLRSRGGRDLLHAGGATWTSLAMGAAALTPPFEAARVAGFLDEESVLVVDPGGRSLSRIDLPTGARTRVFPR